MSQESVWLLVLFLAAAIAAACTLFGFIRRRFRLCEHYQTLAGQLPGAVCLGAWPASPALSFVHCEMPALLTAANDIVLLDSSAPCLTHSLWHTQLHIGWPDSQARCEIFSRPALWGICDPRRKRFETGRRAFDGRYVVRGDSLYTLREFLCDEVQTCIQSIRFLGDNKDVYVGLGGGVLTIRKRGVIRRFETLKRFTALGLQLFDSALRGERAQEMFARRIGIEFVAERAVYLPLGARCPLCGDDILSEVVYCRACRTPHHAGCWRYYGACSMYGCTEEQFTAVVSFSPGRDVLTIDDLETAADAASGRSCHLGRVRLRSCRESRDGAKLV